MIRAGAVLSLSGRFAVQGRQAAHGLELWAAHVNQGDGVSGEARRLLTPLDLVLYDDRSRVAEAAAGVERLIDEDRVELLFGPYGSALTFAAAEVAARHGRLLWNHGGSTDAVAERGWQHVVSMLAPASRYFDGLLRLASAGPRPARRAALLAGARGTFPAAVIGGARASATRLGLTVVYEGAYPDDPSRLPALVREVARQGPDVLLGAGTTEADLALAREVRRQRLAAPVVGLVAAPIQRFKEELGTDADGFYGPSQWEPDPHDRPDVGPTSEAFVGAFRARFGRAPDYPAAQAFTAGLIAEQCATVAGSLAEDALLAAARTLDLTTFYGRFRLDPATGRQIGHELVVVQWQDGQKRVVWPPERAG